MQTKPCTTTDNNIDVATLFLMFFYCFFDVSSTPTTTGGGEGGGADFFSPKIFDENFKKTKFCQMIENAISNSSIAGRPPNSDFLIGFWPGENWPDFFFRKMIFR